MDILAEENCYGDYSDREAYETKYFRVTDLGAFLFGLTDSYTDKGYLGGVKGDHGFIVQPNFDVVITDSPERMRHELFFDRFAEKTVSDQKVSQYKLNFKGMVNALNIGLYIHEISSFCEMFSNMPIPDNVKNTFSEWEAQSSRIRIRTVSVIEADDPYLLEEVKNYRGMGRAIA